MNKEWRAFKSNRTDFDGYVELCQPFEKRRSHKPHRDWKQSQKKHRKIVRQRGGKRR